jgi:adenylate cyclase
MTIGVAVAAGVMATALPTWWAAGGVALLSVLFWAWATAAFGWGWWVNVTLPLTGAAAALFGGVAEQHFVENRERRKLAGLFGLYVSPQVFDRLVNDPTLARLGGEERYMTVLFSDIRGFTAVSERQTPVDMVRLLNDHFSAMVEVIQRHGGMVDKFAGDMVMALFGAPMDDAAHEEHAVDAALEMCAAVDALNARRAAAGQPPLDIGVGINTGAMIAGNVGSASIRSYTVIGDAVNLGSRLESLNKQFGTRVLISDATRRALPSRFACEPRGTVPVKGREGLVEIFEVRGVVPQGGGDVTPPAGSEAVI